VAGVEVGLIGSRIHGQDCIDPAGQILRSIAKYLSQKMFLIMPSCFPQPYPHALGKTGHVCGIFPRARVGKPWPGLNRPAWTIFAQHRQVLVAAYVFDHALILSSALSTCAGENRACVWNFAGHTSHHLIVKIEFARLDKFCAAQASACRSICF
jgi:hypothetical protein